MEKSLELGYVGVEVKDPAGLGRYLSSILGLKSGEPTTEGAPTWRLDGKAHRLIVHEGPADDAAYAGFVAHSEADFDEAVETLTASGAEVIQGTDEERESRRVRGLVRTRAPWGAVLEFAWGLADAKTPFESELVPGGFVTENKGLGHVVYFVSAANGGLDAADKFATEALGLTLSDTLVVEQHGMVVRGSFYHCNRRHHSLALIELPVTLPQTLNHIMVETVSQDNVGLAYDRAKAAGVPIAMELGKHANDRTFGFYSVTPAGFHMEFGFGGAEVDDTWKVLTYDRISAWGHHGPAGDPPQPETAAA
ncbi:VOC family protein [Streptomyces canus]|uniref:VOC family protein n=1 Tax=Streptomyces canus TaxID=58343 RepID=UPI0036CB4A30